MTTAVIEKGTSLPFLAHLYSNQLVFKKSLGRLLNSPPIVSAYGSVGSPVSLLLPAADSSASAPVQGDIVKLTKQGPAALSDGNTLYTGIIDDLPDDYDATVRHEISLLPIGSELGTAGFSNNYTTLTDVGQMIRDAVSVTAHCTATTSTVPNTGITAIFDFSNTSPLRVLEEAKKILGPQWTWICDEIGQVWLVNVNQAAAATYSARRGVDYVSRKYTSKITDLKNFIVAIGGFPTGSALPISAVFDDGTLKTGWPPPIWTHAQLSQYGLRALTPPLIYDRVSDQATLTAIISTIGQQLDRRMTKVAVKLIDYPVRINLARLAGATMRYIEPATANGGSGVFSPNYAILDVTVSGNVQTLTLSDMPVTIDDLKYEIDRMLQDVQYAASTSIGAGTPNVITPPMIVGATAGPNSPTTPAFTGTPTSTGLDMIAQADNAYIIVNWGAAPAADNVAAYELRWHKVGDTNYSYARTSDLSLKIPALIPGQNYAFALRSINNLGLLSAFSSEITRVAATDSGAPVTPTGLVAIKTPRGALVSWNGNSEADLQGYRLKVSVGGGAYSTVFDKALVTSFAYVAPSGTAQNTSLTFEIAAVDWSGNYSADSVASAVVNTDGIVFDELLAGNLKVFGTLTTGGLQTAASGQRFVMDSTSLRAYDATATDYGAGAGIRVKIGADGSGFFSGTLAATVLHTGGIQSAAANNVPAIPGGFTGYQLDPTNGLRFYSGGTLVAQLAPSSLIIYGGTIAGGHIYLTAGSPQMIESANGVGSSVNGIRIWQGGTYGEMDLWGASEYFYEPGATTERIRHSAFNSAMRTLVSQPPWFIQIGVNSPAGQWGFEQVTALDGNGTSTAYWGFRGSSAGTPFFQNPSDLFDLDGVGVWRQSGFSVPGVGSGAGCDIGFPRRFVNAPTGITQVVAAESMSGAAMGVSDISRFGFNNYINYPSGTGNRYTHRYYNPTGGS